MIHTDINFDYQYLATLLDKRRRKLPKKEEILLILITVVLVTLSIWIGLEKTV